MLVVPSLSVLSPNVGRRGVKLAVGELWGELPWTKGAWVPGSALEAPFELAFTDGSSEEEWHMHERSWEVYVFLKGGIAETCSERLEVSEGGVVIFMPKELHLVRPLGPTYVFKFPSGNDKVKGSCHSIQSPV